MKGALAGLLLLVALLAPGAGADHVYSHRFVFEGRLVGSDGLPLPGRTVEFLSQGDSFLEACTDGHRPVTDEWGDFRFCFHKHELYPGAEVGVRVGNVTLMRAMDTAFRRTVVTLEEPNETGVAPEGWATRHLVAGRVWRHGATELEDVRVYGVTENHVPVNVTLRSGPDSGARFELETDGYGDFRLDLRLVNDTRPEDVTVEVEVLGMRQVRELDPTRRVTIGIILPSETFNGTFSDRGAFLERQPGTDTPAIHPALVLAAAAGLALAVWGARRRS